MGQGLICMPGSVGVLPAQRSTRSSALRKSPAGLGTFSSLTSTSRRPTRACRGRRIAGGRWGVRFGWTARSERRAPSFAVEAKTLVPTSPARKLRAMTLRGGRRETWAVLIGLSGSMGLSTFIWTNQPLIAVGVGAIGLLGVAFSPRGRQLWTRSATRGRVLAPLEDVAKSQAARPIGAPQARRPFTLRHLQQLELSASAPGSLPGSQTP